MKIKLFIIVVLLFLALSNETKAAKLYFSVPDEIMAGRIFTAHVLINPEEFINAVEGKIKFNPNILEYKDFSDANSVINLWIERPALIEKDTIMFSGIIPGGVGAVTYKESKIMELSFLAKKAGLARLAFEDFKVYLHQVGAPKASSTAEIATINILEADGKADDKVLVIDFYPPEKFPIFVTKTADSFDGARVAVFSAQDKGSGIDHYEIKEKTLGLFGEWREADSPYVLRHWYPFSIIEVKAVDKVGLERIEKFIPPGLVYLAIGALTLLVILFFTFLVRLIKRVRKIWRG